LTLPETKAHAAPIVTLRPAVRLYERMRRMQVAQGYGGDDHYLFFPGEADRNYALAVLGWQFRRLLEDLGLREGPHGQPRTLYSLRHTAITLRLLYGSGIDILTLARNARTSVDMIERHYASTLTGERNIGMLQSKRTGTRMPAPSR
jgi:integrase